MRSSFLAKYQPKILEISALPNKRGSWHFFDDFLVSVGTFFGYNPWFFGGAEILVILDFHFGRNDDLINSF